MTTNFFWDKFSLIFFCLLFIDKRLHLLSNCGNAPIQYLVGSPFAKNPHSSRSRVYAHKRKMCVILGWYICVSYWAGTFLASPPVDQHSVRNRTSTPNSITNWAATKKPTKMYRPNMYRFQISRGCALIC